MSQNRSNKKQEEIGFYQNMGKALKGGGEGVSEKEAEGLIRGPKAMKQAQLGR